jgi:hypothetical protein
MASKNSHALMQTYSFSLPEVTVGKLLTRLKHSIDGRFSVRTEDTRRRLSTNSETEKKSAKHTMTARLQDNYMGMKSYRSLKNGCHKLPMLTFLLYSNMSMKFFIKISIHRLYLMVTERIYHILISSSSAPPPLPLLNLSCHSLLLSPTIFS